MHIFPGSQLALVVGALHKIIVYAMEYEEAERRTNSVETQSRFLSFLSLPFSLSPRARPGKLIPYQ